MGRHFISDRSTMKLKLEGRLKMWEYFVILFFSLWIWDYFSRIVKLDFLGKHVFITGGSSGIGFSIAKLVVSHGGKVTVVARDVKKLEAAKTELTSMSEEGRVNVQSVDISQNREVLSNNLDTAERIHGPIYMLINCAGYAHPAEFDKIERSQVKGMFDVNFFGTFYLTQLVVERMKQNGTKGKIVFISSLAALFGFYGFSVYAASKSAVNRAAEALYQEVKPFGISVTVALPPDTDTPGLCEENLIKPVECQNISDAGGLFQPEEVAKVILTDAFNKKFYSTLGFNGHLSTCLCSDMTPVTSAFELCCQVMFGGVIRLVLAGYLLMWDRMILKEHQKKNSSIEVNCESI